MKKAKVDDKDAVKDALNHARAVFELGTIAGRPDLFLEQLERGGDGREILDDLHVQVFGPRPFVPWPRLISHPTIAASDDE